jgi:hypothetical protein
VALQCERLRRSEAAARAENAELRRVVESMNRVIAEMMGHVIVAEKLSDETNEGRRTTKRKAEEVTSEKVMNDDQCIDGGDLDSCEESRQASKEKRMEELYARYISLSSSVVGVEPNPSSSTTGRYSAPIISKNKIANVSFPNARPTISSTSRLDEPSSLDSHSLANSTKINFSGKIISFFVFRSFSSSFFSFFSFPLSPLLTC